MIIFLYGQDTYRMREKTREIIEGYKKVHKSGLNLKYFDDFADFKDGFKQTSMFKEKKLAIITNLFSNPEFKKNFSENKKGFLNSEDVILICEERDFVKDDVLFKFLKKNAKTQEFKPLEVQNLKSWAEKEFVKYGAKIEPAAISRLIEYAGDDLWRLANEIKKLASFKRGGAIKAEDVEFLIKPRIEADIFKTIDAIAEKNKKTALSLIHKHLEKGDSHLYILAMINYQFRNLLIIKDLIERRAPYDVILKKSGLHPFVVKKSYYQSQKFSLAELKKIYQKIFEADLNIKTGRIEPETTLDMLVAEI